MTAIQIEVKRPAVVEEFMQWLHKHSKDDVSLTFVRDSSAMFDEDGIAYMEEREQKEIEESLKNPECYEMGERKTLSFDV